jgi:hypothetical protein
MRARCEFILQPCCSSISFRFSIDDAHRSYTNQGVLVEQGQTSPVIMGGYLTSRLLCILCRVKYVLPFVDCSVDMPFLLSLPLRFTRVP